MATTYAYPGVYVEEVDRGTKPIEARGVAVTAFVGITEKTPQGYVPGKWEQIASWTDYTRLFGSFLPDAYLPDAVYGYFNNGGGICYVASLLDVSTDAASTRADCQVGGIAVAAKYKGPHGNQLQVVIKYPKAPAETPAPEKKAAPSRASSKKGDGDAAGDSTSAAAKKGDGNGKSQIFTLTVQRVEPGRSKPHLVFELPEVTMARLREMAQKEAEKRRSADPEGDVADNVIDWFPEVDLTLTGDTAPPAGTHQLGDGAAGKIGQIDTSLLVGDLAARSGLAGLEVIDDIGLIACPDLMTLTDRDAIKVAQTNIIAHCEKMRYRFAILDTPSGLNAAEAKEWRQEVNFDTAYAAMYYPWIEVEDLATQRISRLAPPSGAVAGVYNRVDNERGVHKAPANEVVRGVIGLEVNLSDIEQGTLNPIGVNCIRRRPNRGFRIWGARTLSSDGSWRYINVRRLFSFVGRSLDDGLQWVVFEPNDRTLWAKVRRDVTAFLRIQWLNGALFGATPEQAFYVKCDGDLNSKEIRDVGQLIIEVGLAPVKPAEFVIIRLSQWAGPNAED